MSLVTRVITSLLVAGAALATTACAVDDAAPLATEDATAELTQRPRFELWKDAGGQTHFHLRDADGSVLLASQAYASRAGALGGVLSVLDNGGLEPRYRVATTADGHAYLELVAGNGAVIATSWTVVDRAAALAERDATIAAITAYVERWDTATGARVALHEAAGGQAYFLVHAKNGEVVLRSERYGSEAAALNGAFSVVENGITPGRYQVLPSTGGRYFVRLTAPNGQVIATSELYASRSNAIRARDALVALMPQLELL